MLLFAFAPRSSAIAPGNRDRVLQVMTRNMDAGSDFAYVLVAVLGGADQTALIGAITQTYLEIHGSHIAQRADLIAAEIQNAQPDLVALQEVTVLSAGPYGGPLAEVDNSLTALTQALAQRGLHYSAIVTQKNADLTLPAFSASGLISVGLTDYDVVLARTDLPVSEFQLESTQAAHFSNAATLVFPVAGQAIPFIRGWIAVDAKLRGKSYRFVTTHLESFSPDYQAAQTNELLYGPLQTNLPVILAGDLNSDAHAPSYANGPAYQILTSAGFDDVWLDLHPADPGLTWPMFGEDPPYGPSSPYQRIDLILTKGQGMSAGVEFLTGTVATGGLWPSDHAGAVASFTLLP
jgi:endonuclease/exonuclease/phosphatase family metal-dependent hydrolase